MSVYMDPERGVRYRSPIGPEMGVRTRFGHATASVMLAKDDRVKLLGQVERFRVTKRDLEPPRAKMPPLPSKAQAAKRIQQALSGWHGEQKAYPMARCYGRKFSELREVAGCALATTFPKMRETAAKHVEKLLAEGNPNALKFREFAEGRVKKLAGEHLANVVVGKCAAVPAMKYRDDWALNLHYGVEELERRWVEAERRARIRYGITDRVERVRHQAANGLLTRAEVERQLALLDSVCPREVAA